MRLITPQTGAEGRIVKRLLIAEALDIEQEYYLSLIIDRSVARVSIIASASCNGPAPVVSQDASSTELTPTTSRRREARAVHSRAAAVANASSSTTTSFSGRC